MELPKEITIGKKYEPAMEITEQSEADEYFEACVQHCMSFGKSREEAEIIERQNLGYFAGYYNAETRGRVEKLFSCTHPIFGSIANNGQPSLLHGLEAGRQFEGQSCMKNMKAKYV